MDNLDRLSRMCRLLTTGLHPFVTGHLKRYFGSNWRSHARLPDSMSLMGDLDAYSLLYSLHHNWMDVFRHVLGHEARSAAAAALDGRNAAAHASSDVEAQRTLRALSGAADILALVGADREAGEVRAMRDSLMCKIVGASDNAKSPASEGPRADQKRDPPRQRLQPASNGQTAGYWVYENWTWKKAIVHAAACSYCNSGNGMHKDKSERNGQWLGPYPDRDAAFRAAVATRQKEVRACRTCDR